MIMLGVAWWVWLALGLGGAFFFFCLIALAAVQLVVDALTKLTEALTELGKK